MYYYWPGLIETFFKGVGHRSFRSFIDLIFNYAIIHTPYVCLRARLPTSQQSYTVYFTSLSLSVSLLGVTCFSRLLRSAISVVRVDKTMLSARLCPLVSLPVFVAKTAVQWLFRCLIRVYARTCAVCAFTII